MGTGVQATTFSIADRQAKLFFQYEMHEHRLYVYDESFSSYTVLLIAARAFLFAFFCTPPGFFTRARHFSRISEISSSVKCSMPINAFCAELTRISSSSFACTAAPSRF